MGREAKPTDLGRRVRAVREAAGIARLPLSRVAGFSDSVVFQLEGGLISNPSAELVWAIASALGTNVEYLLRGEGQPPRAQDSQAAFILACENGGSKK